MYALTPDVVSIMVVPISGECQLRCLPPPPPPSVSKPVQQLCPLQVTRHANLVLITTVLMLSFPAQILRRSNLLLLQASPFCHVAPEAAEQYDAISRNCAYSRIFRIVECDERSVGRHGNK